MCCMQGRIVNGCDGKVGGVDRFECTAEAPGGKMLILSIRLSCNAYTLNRIRDKKIIINHFIIQRFLTIKTKEKPAHAEKESNVTTAGKRKML